MGRGRCPPALDWIRFILAGPRGHGNGNCGERLVAQGAELEVGAQRDGQTDARLDRHDFLAVVLPPPHLAATSEKKPDLFDRAMGNSLGRLAGLEFKMCHAAALQAQ